jgi:hypothetical protein
VAGGLLISSKIRSLAKSCKTAGNDGQNPKQIRTKRSLAVHGEALLPWLDKIGMR